MSLKIYIQFHISVYEVRRVCCVDFDNVGRVCCGCVGSVGSVGKAAATFMIAQFVEFYNNEITVEEANTLMAPFECFSDNGAINVRELSMAFLLVAPGSESLEERVDAIFDLTDDDHSGFLTRDSMRIFCLSLTVYPEIASTLRLVFLSSAKFLKAISQIRGNAEIFGCAAVIDRFAATQLIFTIK